MKTRAWCALLVLSAVALTGIPARGQAQTTIDQRLIATQNDGTVGGTLTVALQVKGTNLSGNNTLGSATIDILFDPARLAYLSSTFPNTPSGISLANGYSKFVNHAGGTVRIGVTSMGVNGVDVLGTDLTASYVTWATVSFTIQNPSTGGFTINAATNQIGLFAQEGNSNGAGGTGNSAITNQTLSAPLIVLDELLPVELASFSVKADRAGMHLYWKTATEINNAGFEVERALASSAPGFEARKWVALGFVPGAGSCASERSYSFTDPGGAQGAFLYRLKQIDRDGGVTYSQEAQAPLVLPTQFALEQNYPNPFNPSTVIGFALPEEARVSIALYDIIGRQVAVLLNEEKKAGFHALSFDGSRLASGIYFYHMTARNTRTAFSASKRFVLLR